MKKVTISFLLLFSITSFADCTLDVANQINSLSTVKEFDEQMQENLNWAYEMQALEQAGWARGKIKQKKEALKKLSDIICN